MVDDDELYEKENLTEVDKNNAIKELVIFALVALSLFALQLMIPTIFRVCIHFINNLI